MREQAHKMLNDINQRFCANRDKNREGAYRALQNDLMMNADLFVRAGILSYDKVIDKVTSLEEYIKASGGGRDPAEAMAEWLNEQVGEVESVPQAQELSQS